MGRFGTDIVALATIAGAAAVGGVATFAFLEASESPSSNYRVFEAPSDGMRIEIRSSRGDRDVLIHRDRRIEVRRKKRRRHRHRQIRIENGFERSQAAGVRFAIQETLDADLTRMRARIEADLERMEADLERSRRSVRDRR